MRKKGYLLRSDTNDDTESLTQQQAYDYSKVNEKKVTLLTKDEMQRLFEIPDQKYYPQQRDFVLFHVLYDSSLRISEAFNLDVMAIDLTMKQIILLAEKVKDRRYRN